MDMLKIEYIAVQSKIVKPNDNIKKIFIDNIKELNKDKIILNIKSGDIIAIASKIVAFEQNRIIDLNSINPSKKAIILAEKSNLNSKFIQIVINESEEIIGAVKGALLTLRNGLVQANAGVDKSNAGKNKAILLPENCDEFALEFKETIEKEYNVDNIGVLIVDSATRPLRLGTVGLAIGTSGFPSITDDRGLKDLFGYEMKITYKNVSDNLASGANLIMGESSEAIPFVIIRGIKNLSNRFNWKLKDDGDLKISPDKCLFFSNFNYTSL